MAQGVTPHLPSGRPLQNTQNLHIFVYKEQPDNFHLHDLHRRLRRDNCNGMTLTACTEINTELLPISEKSTELTNLNT